MLDHLGKSNVILSRIFGQRDPKAVCCQGADAVFSLPQPCCRQQIICRWSHRVRDLRLQLCSVSPPGTLLPSCSERKVL